MSQDEPPKDHDDAQAKSDDYVGYKNPPKKNRFRHGQSGNRKGRPKGTKDFRADLLEELAEQIPVRVRADGKPTKVSKQRAILKALFARGFQGDLRAVAILANLIQRFIGTADGSSQEEPPLSGDEKQAIALLESRVLSIHGMSKPSSNENEKKQ